MRKIFGWLFIALGAFLMIAGILLLNGCDLEGNLIDASQITGIQGPQGEPGDVGYTYFKQFSKDLSEANVVQTYYLGTQDWSFITSLTMPTLGFGHFDGTNQWLSWSSSNITNRFIRIYQSSGSYQTGTVSANGTSIDISWEKNSTPTGTYYFIIGVYK